MSLRTRLEEPIRGWEAGFDQLESQPNKVDESFLRYLEELGPEYAFTEPAKNLPDRKLTSEDIYHRAYRQQFLPSMNRNKSFGQHYYAEKFRFAFSWAPVLFSGFVGLSTFAMFPLHSIIPPVAVATAIATASINHQYYKRKLELLFSNIENEEEVEEKMFKNFEMYRYTDTAVALVGCINIFTGVYAFHYRRLISHFNDNYSHDYRVRKIQSFKTWMFGYSMLNTLKRYYFPFAFAVPYVLFMEYANAKENNRLLDYMWSFHYVGSEEMEPKDLDFPPPWAQEGYGQPPPEDDEEGTVTLENENENENENEEEEEEEDYDDELEEMEEMIDFEDYRGDDTFADDRVVDDLVFDIEDEKE